MLSVLLLNFACQSHNSHWGYTGKEAPDFWGELDQSYRSCKDGTHQSPINLTTKNAKQMHQPLSFNYHNSTAEVINNGHTIEVDFTEKNFVELDAVKYFLKQLHFHSHSEHSLDGNYYPAEVHFVHKSVKGDLLVVGIFIELGESEDEIGLFEHIPASAKAKEKTNIRLDAIKQMAHSHFYYQGSLTTPPCTENVHWIIMDKHIFVKKEQLSKFKAFYTNNYRPVQKTKDHVLYHSDL